MKNVVDIFEFTPEQILRHAKRVRLESGNDPGYAKKYLLEFLEKSGYKASSDPSILETKRIIDDIDNSISEFGVNKRKISGSSESTKIDLTEAQKALDLASKEISFRKELEEYFLPKQLVDAVFELGEIPKTSQETMIGIGFIDIADYTYLSKFLSPMENQSVLNGLYTAFNWVLKRHGGYLNKIEGDSLMFHFGGLLDPNVRNQSDQNALRYISKELFYTCVEMQRVCSLFNQANDKFIYGDVDAQTKGTLKKAFDIISTLRNTLELSSSMNALFQIRIRIGANIGKVTIGSFGPEGAKQWDVIGIPVIEAKRMESTAPIGGLRIPEAFYDILRDTGVVDAYHKRFKREASALFSHYKGITQEELFHLCKVILKDKKDAEFVTYSVQVNPALPEDIARQAELLLDKGDSGADKIIEFIKYYRGNRYVIDAIERVFKNHDIVIRKDLIIKTIYPKKYKAFINKLDNNRAKVEVYIQQKYSLFRLLEKLGEYQDRIKSEFAFQSFMMDDAPGRYTGYQNFISNEYRRIHKEFKLKERFSIQKLYFYNMVFPMVFKHIRTSVLEYQNRTEELEEI